MLDVTVTMRCIFSNTSADFAAVRHTVPVHSSHTVSACSRGLLHTVIQKWNVKCVNIKNQHASFPFMYNNSNLMCDCVVGRN